MEAMQRRPEIETELDTIIRTRLGKPGDLLSILEDAQRLDPQSHLPEEVLRRIAAGTQLPLSQIYSVATFYSFFNLTPQGKHSIVVCRGTACHTRGSLALLNEALSRLGIKDFREEEDSSATTQDFFASVRTVACFGQCALAPVIQIDGEVLSRMTVGRLVSILARMRKGGLV